MSHIHRREITCCALVLLFCLCSRAQRETKREPLHPSEIDQLRDAAMDPDQRLKCFIQFERARLTSVEQIRADPKVKDRVQHTHDLLQDFLDIYDELNENIDNFIQRREDMRRPLRAVIAADAEFQSRLRTMETSSAEAKEDAKLPEFLLTTAISTVDASSQDHHQLLQEQEEAAKHKKH
jgi:hypothetical protein